MEFLYVATLKPAPGQTARHARDQRLGISVGYNSSPSRGRDALAWVLTQSDRAPAVFHAGDHAPVGDVAFAVPTAGDTFVVRGSAVARIRNIGRSPVQLDAVIRPVVAFLRARTRVQSS